MPKQPKPPRDSAQLAKYIVDVATGEKPNVKPTVADPKAVERGKARAASLTPAKRKTIAKKAAAARWKKGVKCTPTMAAGIADHVWKIEEIVALLSN